MTDEDLGLRTRKKLATRAAISTAALRLALVHGPENVRVEEIAADAGVSPRTYNNYFASREEAICVIATEPAQSFRTALLARPPAEPLAEAIVHAMTTQYAAEPDRVGLSMIMSSPVLRGEFLKARTAIEGPLAAAIAERVGGNADDLYPKVMAAAVAAATRVAIEEWVHPGCTMPFAAVVREALTQLTAAADRAS